MRDWDKELKSLQKQKQHEIAGHYKNASAKVDVKKTPEYISWNSEISAQYANHINELKDQLMDEYQKGKQNELSDYPIFMAIADEIGYDATGKKITNHDLDLIGEELKKFIAKV